jgi:hypothetical protein
MREAAAALFGAGFTVAGCYAAGALVIDRLRVALRRDERIPLAFVLGAACLHLAVFAILALHLAYVPVLAGLLAAIIGMALWTGAWRGHTENAKPVPPLSTAQRAIFGVCAAAFSILYFVNAWAPEASPDGGGYHLGLVARELRNHGFQKITTSFYAMLSAGVEMLYVPAFAIGQHSATALVHFAFAIFLALAILAYGRRNGKPWAGAAAALLTFASPVAGADGSAAYIDVATAAIVFAVFYWTEIWDEQRGNLLLIPIGLLSGYAFAAKYTAFPIAIYALALVAWRGKQLRPVLLMSGCAFIMAGPWIVRNWIWYHNPIAPFGDWIFRNPYMHIIFEHDYSEDLRTYRMPSLSPLPLEVTIRGGFTQGIIGPVFLLLPVALLALRYRAGRRLLLAGVLVFSTYFANIGTRFLIPCLPFFSLAMAMAFSESAPLLGALIVFHAAASWPPVLKRYVDPVCWKLVRFPFQAALRITPPDTFLREHSYGYPPARLVEEKVPQGEPVLTMTGMADAYTTHEILVSFQSAGNQALADTINMGWDEGLQPTVARVFRFHEIQARRMRVLQTAQAQHPEQWNVHELRFFHQGKQLARTAAWRLRAWPNPWEVQFAFDNSLVTRWRSGEVAFPGMYLEADFGKEELVDEVRLITSSDFEGIRLQLESLNVASRWDKIAGNPPLEAAAVPPDIRRLATQEMHARGIHNLLIYDTNYGAADFARDPGAWGLKLIGQVNEARLYRTIW